MIRPIYERLGIQTDLDQEKQRFINRIRNRLEILDTNIWRQGETSYNDLLKSLVFCLGEGEGNNSLTQFIERKSFQDVLVFCEVLHKVLRPPHLRDFYEAVEAAIDLSVIDLGVTYKNGEFYPQGAKELGETLLVETMDWLKDSPDARDGFSGALKEYLKKDYPDAITKSFSSLESLVKSFLGRDSGLENLISDLLKALKLSNEWKAMLTHFCKYAHEYSSRHGKRDGQNSNPNPSEVESYIYLTGLIMRLIIRAIKDTEGTV